MAEKTYTTPLGKKLGAKPGVEVVVLFTTTRAELKRRFAALRKTLAPADGLWVAWPKKASKLETDLDASSWEQRLKALGVMTPIRIYAPLRWP